ncbi:tetratricopeptide repeat protein [Altererythrobacter aerius]|uniref:Tetratricopeptide repeat protein n=1 Tax=Tsuneonella aeria TaxID=1837929 RepID=A0A6I4T9N9_9SPHN|nr:tetratricopeptide repeat protein [Tsuneonella aeria]MXO73833.1 tetratricopeptide repeat protein [Tsuneonella aeria]
MTNRITPAVLAVAMFFTSACAPSPEESLAEARASFAEHRFSEARVHLLSAIEGGEVDGAALDLLARTQLELGDGEGAMTTLERLRAMDRAPADAAILAGDAQLLRGKPDLAIASVEGLRTSEAWRVRALAALRGGDHAGASQAFTAGAAADGSRARLLGEAARYALLRGDLEGARTALAGARGKDEPLEAMLAAGELAAAEGRHDAALAEYEAAGKRWPESRPVLLGRLSALGDLGRTTEMAPLLKAAAARTPGDPSIVYLQARLAAAEGDWQRTRSILQPEEERLDTMPQAQLLYGQSLGELGLHQQAIGHFRAYLRSQPGRPAALRLLGRAQLASGDAPAAVATLRPLASAPGARAGDVASMAAATKAAGTPDAAQWQARARDAGAQTLATRLAQADAALRKEDWSGASAGYRAILGMTDGRNAMVLNNLAYAEGRQGNHAVAHEHAQAALKLAPGNASVLDTAGWIMVEGGIDREGGIALLRKAAELAPQNPAIARHLALATR